MRWIRFFGRGGRSDEGGSARPQPPARKSGTWAAGDHAECIASGNWFEDGVIPAKGPAHGEVRVVRAVGLGPHFLSGAQVQFLIFERYGTRQYCATGFRKVTPRADEAVAADTAFLRALTGAPAPSGRTPS
jgi:hypothetical protein